MHDASILENTAEVAITLAGFVGLFLVLARRDGAFSPGDALLIRVLLVSCIPPVFYAALAFILLAFGIPEVVVWRSASTIAGVGVAAISGSVIIVHWRLPSEERALLPVGLSLASYSLGTASVFALLSNALGWPAPPSGALYLAGIWFILGVAVVMFTFLLLRRVLAA